MCHFVTKMETDAPLRCGNRWISVYARLLLAGIRYQVKKEDEPFLFGDKLLVFSNHIRGYVLTHCLVDLQTDLLLGCT